MTTAEASPMAPPAPQELPTSDELLAMGVQGRQRLAAERSQEEIGRLLAATPQDALVAMGRQGVAALRTYRARLLKQERINGKLVEPQALDITVQADCRAFRIDFVKGPAKGRRVLYNAELRPTELRVKEAGMLGLAGALWIDLDNPMTRRDTNHRASELGFLALLDLIDADMKRAQAGGGHSRRDEGIGKTGLFGSVYTAPKDLPGLYAVSTRIGFELASSLLMEVEVTDREGLLETYRYESVSSVSLAPDFFTPKAAGL